jgi:hypothetical protein
MSVVDGRADVPLEMVHAPLSAGLRMGDASRMRLSVSDEGVERASLGVTCGARIGWALPSWPSRGAPGGGTQLKLGLLLRCMGRWEGMASDAS